MNPELFAQIESLPRTNASTLDLVENTIKKSNENGFGTPNVAAKILIASIFSTQFRTIIFSQEDSDEFMRLFEQGKAKYQLMKQTSPIQQNFKAVFQDVESQGQPIF